jgi:hypothetical protein
MLGSMGILIALFPLSVFIRPYRNWDDKHHSRLPHQVYSSYTLMVTSTTLAVSLLPVSRVGPVFIGKL